MSDLPLAALLHNALESANKAYSLPTFEDDTQELIQLAIDNLFTLRSRITELALFSPNEALTDIATKDLIYLFVPYVLAQVLNRRRIIDREERIEHIQRVLSYFRSFLSTLETYNIVPELEKTLYERYASSMNDFSRRRELKTKQFQKEKELKGRIESLRKRRNHAPDIEPSSDFEFIASLLPTSSTDKPSADEDPEVEENLREAILTLLRLFYGRAHGDVDSLQQELELLKNAPSEPPRPPVHDPRAQLASQQDDMWRLDAPRPTGGPDGKGPLLDPSGKPLRPFTILPSGAAADRSRLQAQVFQPDHRLPTMSVDQYLEIERQRGNIITGSGPQSEAKLTTSEQLQLDSEMDGTVFGEEKVEEKRQKDEKWAQYTDTHPRGAGNTMNRG